MAPSFFKILLNPSAPHLPLPPDFVSMHLENKIPKGPVILSANGGYSWRLKIKQIDDRYCFTNGWNNVVQDIQLRFGDFLCFQPLDQSTFEMSIYSPSGCEKTLAPKGEHDGINGVEYVDIEDDKNDEVNDKNEDDDDPFFTFIITKTHTRVLRFPVEFARLAGIDAEGTMVMKNIDGEEWHMGLKMEKTHGTIRYYLRTGWCGFLRENDLSEGDKCVIKFVRSENKLLLAKITKQEWLAMQPQSSRNNMVAVLVKRKRGQPTKQQQPSIKIPVAVVVKRKRGRPIKQQQPSNKIPVAAVVKRKRGRPIKQQQPSDKILVAAVVKRKRGRPIKQQQPSNKIPVAAVVKRKRGRPIKQPQPSNKNMVAVVVKRKRGRPTRQPQPSERGW